VLARCIGIDTTTQYLFRKRYSGLAGVGTMLQARRERASSSRPVSIGASSRRLHLRPSQAAKENKDTDFSLSAGGFVDEFVVTSRFWYYRRLPPPSKLLKPLLDIRRRWCLALSVHGFVQSFVVEAAAGTEREGDDGKTRKRAYNPGSAQCDTELGEKGMQEASDADHDSGEDKCTGGSEHNNT